MPPIQPTPKEDPSPHALLELVEKALSNLAQLPGFTPRASQEQVARLIAEFLFNNQTALLEAPTGLGKSLAALIPAIALAITENRRVAIATYTNILCDQVWRKDLPLAMSLFDEKMPNPPALLLGRQRYICVSQLKEAFPQIASKISARMTEGLEPDAIEAFKAAGQRPQRWSSLWQTLSVPPVCEAKACPDYEQCFYYQARNRAMKANLIITNHALLLQDAIAKSGQDLEENDDEFAEIKPADGILGRLDAVVLDEAHDFLNAAFNAFEFELDEGTPRRILAVAGRIIKQANRLGPEPAQPFNTAFQRMQDALKEVPIADAVNSGDGVIEVEPTSLKEHPQVGPLLLGGNAALAEQVVGLISRAIANFLAEISTSVDLLSPADAKTLKPQINNALTFLKDFIAGTALLLKPNEGVSYRGKRFNPAGPSQGYLRTDVHRVDHLLQEIFWQRNAVVALSATLALDGNFEFFQTQTGAIADFDEILPSPFDFGTQAALYVPPPGRVPDYGAARAGNQLGNYYSVLASEVSEIITLMSGRTLVLLPSRKDMDEVFARLTVPSHLPVLKQNSGSVALIGQKFKNDPATSLLALRSFWTGFDAPGETLSCVVVTRIPFESPADTPAIVRSASLVSRGIDPFGGWSLPQAKMLIRQGVGRLIRNTSDRGVIAILDPRVRTKRYGEEILQNLPPDMREFDDVANAIGHVGL